MLTDQLFACDLEVLVALWDPEKINDTIPFKLIRSELKSWGYPIGTIARIMMQHSAPMWGQIQWSLLRFQAAQRQWSCTRLPGA